MIINNVTNFAKLRTLLALALFVLICGLALPGFRLKQQVSRQATEKPATNSGWTHTGNLNTARYSHTATLLESGQVLVAGGAVGAFCLCCCGPDPSSRSDASAELYDPHTATWNYTGSLNTARRSHTATLLENGQVLVAGGYADVSRAFPLQSAEIYDPATGGWRPIGSFNTIHGAHSTTLLATGKVLAVGLPNDGLVYRAELYDPATETWTNTDSPNIGVYLIATTILLPNGKVLALSSGSGPYYGPSSSGDSAALYDPTTDTWSSTGNPRRRFLYTMTLLRNGKVLVTGSDNIYPSPHDAELYDPNTGEWTITGSLSVIRRNFELPTATLLPDGRVLLAGGHTSDPSFPGDELYDPFTESWSIPSRLSEARHNYHTATLLQNGVVLVVGGVDEGADQYVFPYDSAELFDPGTVPCAAQISPTNQFFSSMGGDGSVNLATGCDWTVSNNSNWIVLTSSDSGSGPGTVTFEVRQNITGSSRSSVIVTAGQNFTVVQDAGLGEDCQYLISPQFQVFPAGGGAGLVNVSANSRCAWSVTSGVSWITITSNSSGIGDGVVTYSVATNPNSSGRKGTITIGGQAFTVKQKGTGL